MNNVNNVEEVISKQMHNMASAFGAFVVYFVRGGERIPKILNRYEIPDGKSLLEHFRGYALLYAANRKLTKFDYSLYIGRCKTLSDFPNQAKVNQFNKLADSKNVFGLERQILLQESFFNQSQLVKKESVNLRDMLTGSPIKAEDYNSLMKFILKIDMNDSLTLVVKADDRTIFFPVYHRDILTYEDFDKLVGDLIHINLLDSYSKGPIQTKQEYFSISFRQQHKISAFQEWQQREIRTLMKKVKEENPTLSDDDVEKYTILQYYPDTEYVIQPKRKVKYVEDQLEEIRSKINGPIETESQWQTLLELLGIKDKEISAYYSLNDKSPKFVNYNLKDFSSFNDFKTAVEIEVNNLAFLRERRYTYPILIQEKVSRDTLLHNDTLKLNYERSVRHNLNIEKGMQKLGVNSDDEVLTHIYAPEPYLIAENLNTYDFSAPFVIDVESYNRFLDYAVNEADGSTEDWALILEGFHQDGRGDVVRTVSEYPLDFSILKNYDRVINLIKLFVKQQLDIGEYDYKCCVRITNLKLVKERTCRLGLDTENYELKKLKYGTDLKGCIPLMNEKVNVKDLEVPEADICLFNEMLKNII